MKYTLQKRILICTLSTCSILAGCTDTETIEPPALPVNRILTYTVVNTPTTIHGAVNGLDSTIVVYIPYYYYLDLLQPEITVSAGASVAPESGTMIEDLVRVVRGDTVIHYTVTGADGSKATYRLRVETQQPELTLNELTTDPASPAEFPASFLYLNKYEIYSPVQITGKNLFKSAGGVIEAKVTFINEQGTEISALDIASANTSSLTAIVPFTTDIPDGLYRIRVDCYSQTVTLKNPIRIKTPQ